MWKRRIRVVDHFRKSFLSFCDQGKKFEFSSQAQNWVHQNQLFQRHPRLKFLEEQCDRTFHHLSQLLAYVIVSGLHRNSFVMSRVLFISLIDLEGGDGVERAEFGVRVFNQMDNPNSFSWNTLIRFYAEYDPTVALNFYVKMFRQGRLPDKYTFPFLLKACRAIPDMGSVKQLHCHALKLLMDHDLFIQNSLVDAYMECDSITDALLLFDEMPEKDVVSWTSLISGLVSVSKYNQAVHVFREMLAANSHVRPNVVTIVSTMSACGDSGSMNATGCMHALLEKTSWLEVNTSVANSLIDAYAKCGDLGCAGKIFKDIKNVERDLYSWTAIISGYAMHGQGFEALNMFIRLEQECGLIPDAITYVAILSACAHSGLIEEGLSIFESMDPKHGIDPDLRHYGCIVDLFGRAGMLERAFDIVEKMPMAPNLAVLGSLLSSCRLHNKMELSKAILTKIDLLKEKGGAPVLLSNMYATESQWGKVMDIRKEMRRRMCAKPSGRSWIQVKDAVFEFAAGNELKEDPQPMQLHVVLESLEKISKSFCSLHYMLI